MSPNNPGVPQALATISDDVLEQAIAAATAFEEGRPDTIDEAAQTLFLMTARAVMQECLDWRRRAGLIRDLAGRNVIMIGGRA